MPEWALNRLRQQAPVSADVGIVTLWLLSAQALAYAGVLVRHGGRQNVSITERPQPRTAGRCVPADAMAADRVRGAAGACLLPATAAAAAPRLFAAPSGIHPAASGLFA